MRTTTASALALLLALPQVAAALPLISEVFYDASGSDDGQGFVELYGAPGTVLDGLSLQGVNGSNGDVTDDLLLAGTIPADGLFVVADGLPDDTTAVAEADLILDFDFQNGPDSVRLLASDGVTVLDAVGYGTFDPDEFFAGEGSPADDAPAGASIARLFADVDSDDNAADFAVATPSPGTAVVVPEPATATLFSAGLAALARAGRRRRRRRTRSGED